MRPLPPLLMVIMLAACAPGTPAGSESPVPSQTMTIKQQDPRWSDPTRQIGVQHDVAVPPLPVLVEVRTGDHTAEGYERITFAFRGPFPSYTVQLVPQVVRDGTGDPVTLPGTAFLSIVFTPARSDADTGPHRVGFRRIVGYEQVGDYEGYVSYGLGTGAAPRVRTGESTRPDGSNVVSVDLEV